MGSKTKYVLSIGIIFLLVVFSTLGMSIQKTNQVQNNALNKEIAITDSKKKQLQDDVINLKSAKMMLQTQLFNEKQIVANNKIQIELLIKQGQQRMELLNQKLSKFSGPDLTATKTLAAGSASASQSTNSYIPSNSNSDYNSAQTYTDPQTTVSGNTPTPEPTPQPTPAPEPTPTAVTAAS